MLRTACESLDASRQAANSGSVSQKWHINQSSRSAIQLCSLAANKASPSACQGLANEPPLLSWGVSNPAPPSDTTTCWGWKLFNEKKKTGSQLESHSAMGGSQTHHRHETCLPLLPCKSSVPCMTQLGWYTETSHKAHHLPFCFVSLNVGCRWQISSLLCMQRRCHTWVSKADSTSSAILQLSNEAAQTGEDDTTNISKIRPLTCQLEDKNWLPLVPTVKRQPERKGPRFHNLWKGRWQHEKFGQHCSTVIKYLGPSLVWRISWEFINSVSKKEYMFHWKKQCVCINHHEF